MTATGPVGHRRRWWPVVLVVLVVWVVAAAVTVLRAADELELARERIGGLETLLREGDLPAARLALTEVVAGAASASQRLDALHVEPFNLVPVVGPNLRAARAVSHAARDTGTAAVGVVDAMRSVIGEDAPSGGIDVTLTRVDKLGPALRRLADTLTVTTDQVRESAHGTLLGRVGDARRSYLDLAEPQRERAEVAAALADQLPVLLGGDEPRRYLVGAASLAELRGSGGLIGSFSVMTADAGRLSFEEFVGIDDVERTTEHPDVRAPSAEYAQRYRGFAGLRLWRNANLSPDFPSTAQVLLELWRTEDRPPLDGVILADSETFAQLIASAGAVEVPGVTTLTADNARRFVGLEAYAAFDDHDERKRVLGAVATAAFGRAAQLLDDGELAATLDVLAAVSRGGNLLVYSRDRDVQDALVRAGVAGQLDDVPGEFAGVVVNNVAGNKVDYFTDRRTRHRVKLVEDGYSAATVEVTFANAAPTEGFPRYVLGPWAAGAGPGDNLSEVSVLCGRGCTVTDAPPRARSRGPERGRAVSDLRLSVPAGQERTLHYATRTPQAWRTTSDGGLELTVRHQVQPTLAAQKLEVEVTVPAGYELADGPEGAVTDGGRIRWSAEERPDRVKTLRYRFRPVDHAA